MMRFSNKVALVSGAASGIGLATSQRLISEGATVIMADINKNPLEDAVKTLGKNAIAMVLDVSQPNACQKIVNSIIDRFQRLDIAINNAGIGSPPQPIFEEYDIDEWHQILNVNLNGVFYAMRAEIAAMRMQGSGIIVNTASVASIIAAKGMPAYIAAKHGVAGLTKAAALDVADVGIRVNAVCPGFVETGLTQHVLADNNVNSAIKASIPLKRIATPNDIAAAILFLASDEATYATGSLMVLDGGTSII